MSSEGQSDGRESTFQAMLLSCAEIAKNSQGHGIQDAEDQWSEVDFKPPFGNLVFKIRSPHCHSRICWDVVATLVIHSRISTGKMDSAAMSRID